MSLAKHLEGVRAALRSSNYILTERVFEMTHQLFVFCVEKQKNHGFLRQRAPQYGSKEFLLNVDSQGLAVLAPATVVADFRKVLGKSPKFALWFQEATCPDHKHVLLVARWLCHLVGFRHRCTDIFLDHPTLKDYTFVQLRSFGKADSPGHFDVPVGGHARGLDTPEETAQAELKGELHLDIQQDIMRFRKIGSYDYCQSLDRPDFHNVEHRTVFCGIIKEAALPKIKFTDGEVAALCLFSIKELATMVKRASHMAASGLLGSFPIYMTYRSAP